MNVWHPMATAPRDRPIRVKAADGTTYFMRFSPPHWWMTIDKVFALADENEYAGSLNILLATEWQDVKLVVVEQE